MAYSLEETTTFDVDYTDLENNIKRFKRKQPTERALRNFKYKLQEKLAYGFPIDYQPNYKNSCDSTKCPLLTKSITLKCDDFTDILLDAGADVNIVSYAGYNSIIYFSIFIDDESNLKVFKKIIDRTTDKETLASALAFICEKHLSSPSNITFEAIKMLLDAGADISSAWHRCTTISNMGNRKLTDKASKLKNSIAMYRQDISPDDSIFYEYEL